MYKGHKYKGLFVSFEGLSGTGKTAHFTMVDKFLRDRGFAVHTIGDKRLDPNYDHTSETINGLLMGERYKEIGVIAELLLNQGARAQEVTRLIVPSLEKGMVVLARDFYDPTIAHSRAPKDIISAVIAISAQGVYPDRTYLFDNTPENIATRINSLHGALKTKDRDEIEEYRQADLELAKRNPDRALVVNTEDFNNSFQIVRGDLMRLLREKKLVS